jgi:signal transduction histidine kinase
MHQHDDEWEPGWRRHWRGGGWHGRRSRMRDALGRQHVRENWHGLTHEERDARWRGHWLAHHGQGEWGRRLQRRLRHRMHRKLHARFKHSLGARLTFIFLGLAAMGSLGTYLALQHAMGWGWLLGGGIVLTMMAYGSIRHLLRPLRALAHGAAVFGRGELSHRIRVHHRDEIGALAVRFNRMADDIGAMLDAKRGLLLAISHELRSPLTRARLNAELIDEGPPQQAVVKELGLMRDLIESLLERERLDAGHSALSLEACDIRALVSGLQASRFDDAIRQGSLRVELASDLPESVELDGPRVKVLIGNLVDNALRHHDARHDQPVRLTVSMRPADDAHGRRLQLVVRDWGHGVREDDLAKLGQPFYRPDSARTRQDGGVGLGLNLCHLIVAAHGGSMALRNAGPGLEVSVTLPA